MVPIKGKTNISVSNIFSYTVLNTILGFSYVPEVVLKVPSKTLDTTRLIIIVLKTMWLKRITPSLSGTANVRETAYRAVPPVPTTSTEISPEKTGSGFPILVPTTLELI